jgi:hypothetical protein
MHYNLLSYSQEFSARFSCASIDSGRFLKAARSWQLSIRTAGWVTCLRDGNEIVRAPDAAEAPRRRRKVVHRDDIGAGVQIVFVHLMPTTNRCGQSTSDHGIHVLALQHPAQAERTAECRAAGVAAHPGMHNAYFNTWRTALGASTLASAGTRKLSAHCVPAALVSTLRCFSRCPIEPSRMVTGGRPDIAVPLGPLTPGAVKCDADSMQVAIERSKLVPDRARHPAAQRHQWLLCPVVYHSSMQTPDAVLAP